MAFKSPQLGEIHRVPSHQSFICTTRVEARWLSAFRIDLVIPTQVKYSILVAFAESQVLHTWTEDVPHVDKLVVAGCGDKVTAGAEFDTVKVTLVAA